MNSIDYIVGLFKASYKNSFGSDNDFIDWMFQSNGYFEWTESGYPKLVKRNDVGINKTHELVVFSNENTDFTGSNRAVSCNINAFALKAPANIKKEWKTLLVQYLNKCKDIWLNEEVHNKIEEKLAELQ